MTMTYNSLVLQIESYLNRNDADTIAQIPNFIYQAEQRICRESKNVGLVVYVTSAFLPGNSVISKPGRWRRTLTFNYGTGALFNTRNQLYLRSYEYLRAYSPDSTLTGKPLYYSDYGYTHWLVAPTPDIDYPFEIGYLELPEPLSIAVQTNWLTNYAPDLLLYGCLLEAIPFLKNDERIPVWQNLYDRALASVENQDTLRLEDRASNRSAD
jgi:hypothetical protein